jgi:hypothetical protein
VRILRKILRIIVKPIANKNRGIIGEAKVNSKLNPLLFENVEHRQINNMILMDDNGKSHQIDHVEIRSNGIFCIETKNIKGWIFGNEHQDKWTQCLYNRRYQFINPLRQNMSHVYYVAKTLDNKYKVNSIIVFAQNNADKIDIPNVVNLRDLRDYLNRYNDDTHYSTEEIDYIYTRLQEANNRKITNRDHVNSIMKTQRELRKGICPRCGGKLIQKTGKYGLFYGCENYPNCTFVLNRK